MMYENRCLTDFYAYLFSERCNVNKVALCWSNKLIEKKIIVYLL